MFEYNKIFYVLILIALNYNEITGKQVKNYKWNKAKRANSGNDNNKDLLSCETNDGVEGECQTPTYCFSQFNNFKEYENNICDRNDDQTGICCPKKLTRKPITIKIPFGIPVPYQTRSTVSVGVNILNEAIDEAIKSIKQDLTSERNLISSGFYQKPGTTESYHQAVFGPDSTELRKCRNDGKYALEVSIQLAKKLNLTPTQARDGLIGYSLNGTRLSNHCLKPVECQTTSKYRTIDGSCNNARNPHWGQSLTQFVRLLPPNYSDGLNEFRVSVEDTPLPGPRELSTDLTITGELTDKNLAVMFMQWGQFMDHDLTLGASTRANTGEGLICCNGTNGGPVISHPACRPIMIPRDDVFYGQFGRRCNNFVRNSVATRDNCNIGFREQTNVITHFMDGSMIYGNTDNRSRIVRSFSNGLLLTSNINGREFLPFDTTNISLACNLPINSSFQCVYTGDTRNNQQIGLTVLQLIFLREHNRIATELGRINQNWNDETLFQETRRIIGAIIQSISYNEWLPLILGRSVMKVFGLLPKPSGFTYDYNPDLNPGILNGFAAAAFRWHTMVQGFYDLKDRNGETNRLQLRDIFNNPSILYRSGAVDETLNCVTNQRSQAFDPTVSPDIKNHLFPQRNTPFGADLISINIQRGRDHGLPTYNAYREVCGLPRVRNFNELDRVLRPGSAQRFSKIYKNIDDIDLFIAGVHEIPLKEGILGPTFACIVAEQFRRTKFGDRFWFENGNMAHSFTEAQLNEIRKISLSSLICLNGDDIERTQPFAFLISNDNWNPKTDCKKFEKLNLNLWES